ncbi:hypothetical protein QBC34DRAFT_357172 [Podospora aff. communis PSN243]|uniref:Nephrocystin 3-like N-terminal domain-containing protein n=1 Tax=Podospora aff. communis PSN243 TaxID=3040156 RepID=A0AAV9GCH0_9PEZI|nr:hypothetical protein QBC34DRAFT_357172 [Podospora aff. communis PSN243]
MAEVLALGASIIAVIQAAERIVKVCKYFIESVNSYPSDLRLIYIEVAAIKANFESLEFVEKHDREVSAFLKTMTGPGGPFSGCLKSILELEKLVPPGIVPRGSKTTKRRKTETLVAALAWPLKKETARALLSDIAHYKSTISNALSTEILQDVKDMKRSLKEVTQQLTGMSATRVIRYWLNHSDSSPNHNAACGLYESGTGNWVLRTDEWKSWINLKYRCLWIHGIPGAGKTILAAHLTEEIASLESKQYGAGIQQTSRNRIASVYYYCSHARNQDEAGPFLRWIIPQLCRKVDRIPSLGYNMFMDGRQPTMNQLLSLLEVVLSYFLTVYVTIDAVDESQERQNLLNILVKLASDPRFGNLQLLVTSREYADIKAVMSKISRPLSMSNPHVEADISVYVAAKVRSTSKFRHWPALLRDEVEQALAVGAKGMFRWAVCQLDILRRLREISKIRTALENLPETLDDTYVRIFACVDEHDWSLLRHALRMISFHETIYKDNPKLPGVTKDIILASYSAFTLQSTAGTQANVDHLHNSDSLEEICGCLVSFRTRSWPDTNTAWTGSASLAHYTVREFIESGRCAGGPASYFHNSPGATNHAIFTSILRHAIDATHQPRSKWFLDGIEGYCLQTATVALAPLETTITDDSALLDAVMDLLNPLDRRYSIRMDSLRALFHTTSFGSVIKGAIREPIWDLVWISAPEDREIGALTTLCFGGYMTLAAQVLSNTDLSTLVTTKISVCFPTKIVKSGKMDFKGSPFNLFAECSHLLRCGDLSLRLLYRSIVAGPLPRRIRPSTLLAKHYSGSFWDGLHVGYDDRGGSSVIEWLLELGADPNPMGYRVTPLQRMVQRGDKCAVRALLKAGADPNGCGDSNGAKWCHETTIGREDSQLHGHSPLYIVETYREFRSSVAPLPPTVVNEIKNLLLKAGARPFKLSNLEIQEGVSC